MSLLAILFLLYSAVADPSPGGETTPRKRRDPAIAILPFANANQEAARDGVGASIAAMFGTHLKNETSFMVLERSQIAKIVGEQAMESSGLTDAQRLQLGRLLQAEVILTGEVSRFGSLVQMDARLVSVENGQVLVAEYASIDGYAKLRESVVAISKALEMKYLRRWMGDLVVSVQPVDAEVYLGEQFVGKASLKAPLRIGNLLEGRYSLKVLAAGYSTVSDTVSVVPRGLREVQVALKALPGSLRLTSDPVGARVSVNGKEVGVAPTRLDTLPEGRYHVEFALGGFKQLQRDVEVKSGQQSEVKGVLEVLSGKVVVTSDPSGATVFLDDRRIGSSPLAIENVSPGSHAVRLELPGRSVVRDVVQVKPGEEMAWSGSLDPLEGSLTAVPRTDSVKVRIYGPGGRLLETLQAPFHRKPLDIGEYVLEFSRPMHDTVRLKAVVGEDRETRLEPTLREKTATIQVRGSEAPAEVWIDGRYAGRTGRAEAQVPKGAHEVRWSSFFAEGKDSVKVSPDERRVVVVDSRRHAKARWAIPMGLVLSTLLLFAAGR
jgi:TolB-like protein